MTGIAGSQMPILTYVSASRSSAKPVPPGGAQLRAPLHLAQPPQTDRRVVEPVGGAATGTCDLNRCRLSNA